MDTCKQIKAAGTELWNPQSMYNLLTIHVVFRKNDIPPKISF